MNLIVSAIGQGFLWGLLGLGLFLSFRIMNTTDMTVEGTFPLGAAVSVSLIVKGVDPYLATLAAFLAGAAAGLVTALLITKGKIPSLLAGILTMTGIYSVNLMVMGKSNVSLLGQKTIYSSAFLKSLPQYFDSVFAGTVLMVLVTVILIWFLTTDFGQAFIATGDNPQMAKSQGISPQQMTVAGLMISNGLVGLCGAVVAQSNGYADVNMGTGTIVIALASIIISEVIFRNLNLASRLFAVTLGSIVYRLLLLAVLQVGLSSNNLNLISSLVLAACMMLPQVEAKLKLKQTFLKGLKHD
ncbi:ABC transporter permease [Lactobacillus nasalidis]|uniref:ABC transporter permease n=1 Tax=Lactobacillus nasalidis TaxID=2797258 RepID=A0ABQ3W2B0_9LACO|nr:ABC transporter permease [Lactobacillus nasalidis]GHV97032.1 ABC transporter permease [Lactobacillus nasalidis]GHV99786.1 ABC transporter permease [Lactobacillus nasalidis]GHW00393.1 ABC transporter permease [Lactobacillus nasalidis]